MKLKESDKQSMKIVALILILLSILGCSTPKANITRCIAREGSLKCNAALKSIPIIKDKIVKRMGSLQGATRPELVLLKSGRKAVYKKGSNDVTIDETIISEVIAYRLSELFGFNKVPETTFIERGGRIGSLQLFVENSGRVFTENEVEFYKMKIFDFIISNYDRHSDNYIIKDDGTLAYIDHGEAFQPESESILNNLSRRKVEKVISVSGLHNTLSQYLAVKDKDIKLALAGLPAQQQDELMSRISFLRNLVN